jgi:hypothetical protein
MTGDEYADAAARPDTPTDTFTPSSVDDRFRKTVRDDHAPNQALHDALTATADTDERIHSVNLIGSHAPGNRGKGEPRYYVRVDVRNDGMGHPVLGATAVGRLVDRNDVRIIDVAECSDDHVVVCIRPIETRVEPIEVPVDDMPDDVRGVDESAVAAALGDIRTRLHEELRSVSALCIFDDVVAEYDRVIPDPDLDGADHRLRLLDARLDDHPDGAPAVIHPDRDLAEHPMPPYPAPGRPPTAPIREWVKDNPGLFDASVIFDDDDFAESIAHQITAAIEKTGELGDDDPFESVTVPCGCGKYDVAFISTTVPDSFDVVCPECGNHFGQGPPPDSDGKIDFEEWEGSFREPGTGVDE